MPLIGDFKEAVKTRAGLESHVPCVAPATLPGCGTLVYVPLKRMWRNRRSNHTVIGLETGNRPVEAVNAGEIYYSGPSR
jgi:hypothetical protein